MEMQGNSSPFPHKITKKNSLYTKFKDYTQKINSLFTKGLYNADLVLWMIKPVITQLEMVKKMSLPWLPGME
jgi:hypothetical protein